MFYRLTLSLASARPFCLYGCSETNVKPKPTEQACVNWSHWVGGDNACRDMGNTYLIDADAHQHALRH